MTIHQLTTKVIGITVLAGMMVLPGLAGQGGGTQAPAPAKENGSQATTSPPTSAAAGDDNISRVRRLHIRRTIDFRM